MSDITVTGNKAQFNEDVVFLKEVDIRGDLVLGNLTRLDVGKLDITGDLDIDNLLVRKNLNVLGESDFTGITTNRSGTIFGLAGIYTGNGLLETTLLTDLGSPAVTVINEGTAGSGIDFPNPVDVPGFRVAGRPSNAVFGTTNEDNPVGVAFIPSTNTKIDAKGNPFEEPYGHLNISGKYVSFTGVTTTSFQRVGIGVTNPVRDIIEGTSTKFYEISSGVDPETGEEETEKVRYPVKIDRSKIKLDIDGSVHVGGGHSIGIGTTRPTQSFHTIYNIRIDNEIFDSRNLPGDPGNFLSKDANGITWVSFEPNFTEGVFLMEENVYVPAGSQFTPGNIGAGQSFQILNFVERNSLGVGTDTTLVTARDPNSATGLATIFTSDLWGFVGGGNNAPIYRMSNVGIKNPDPSVELDVTGSLHVTNNVDFDNNLNVDGNTVLQQDLDVQESGNVRFNNSAEATSFNNAPVIMSGGLGIAKRLFVEGEVDFNSSLDVAGVSLFRNDVSLSADNRTFKVRDASLVDKFTIFSNTGNTNIQGTLDIIGITSVKTDTQSTDIETGALIVKGGVGIGSSVYIGGHVKLLTNLRIDGNLDVDGHTDLDDVITSGVSTFTNTVDLDGAVKDINDDVGFSNAVGVCKTDYRLSSVGTGVSWRPSGVQTKRTIWVSKNGCDSNSGLLEGDAKATIGGAAAIAVETDTIKVRPGIYIENNPIGLRTDVTVTGEDLRLVIIQAGNPNKDIFHVRRGCLIENLNFGGTNVGVDHTGSACVAFPPPTGADSAVSGYTAPGPATEGPSGRWRSPYVRNCTNFMTSSIGMKIDGDNATASTIGADLKSMVCDSFTQYNENGIGVSLTNDAYAQLVSIFTINTDIAIYASSGAQCDLTNSNSSFGNFGLVAVGLGSTLFTGIATNVNPAGLEIVSNSPDTDTIVCSDVFDANDNPRRPFDGQALFFQINLDNYPDTTGTGRITAPLERLSEVNILPGVDVSGYSAVDPPSILIRDVDGTTTPKGPQSIIAEATANVSAAGTIESVTVVAQGRNYLPTQNLVVDIEGNTGLATAVTEPIFFTVESATPPTNAGLTTVTFNEFIPYEVFNNDPFSLQRISRILTSSHSFEYVGTGTDINIATPLQGAIPIKANEVVASGGAQIPFTSTDQKGNFDIGEGIQIDQTTSTVRGRDFARAIQAEVTPLILALR